MDDIAIVGIGCRMPGAGRGAERFWDFLMESGDGISEVPIDRWDVDAYYSEQPRLPGRMSSRWGGFLDRVDGFDREFFAIPAHEADVMDPQHRVFLETAWEALEDAAIVPSTLAGSRTGVVLATYGLDYAAQVFSDHDRITSYSVTGTLHSMAAGRLSYLLDLRGPAVVLDSACSSSLVAVHHACRDLVTEDCDVVICGAVNLLLSPEGSIGLSQLNESFVADGQIKAFDEDAAGFVRGEGSAVLVLKRVSDALAAGDRIRAVIKGTAVNQDGRGAGLMAPSGLAHRELVERALTTAGISRDEVGFVEAHGTGTRLGDPIEAQALKEVFDRRAGAPLYLGSVKTNIGHLESAAGLAGLVKATLAVEHATIPPSRNFRTLNPGIDFSGTLLRIATAAIPWPSELPTRVAGVSSFGLNGTNAHVVIAEAPVVDESSSAPHRPVAVLALSAKTPVALSKAARRHAAWLDSNSGLEDQCAAATIGRSAFRERLAVVATDVEGLRETLGDVVRGSSGTSVVTGRATPDPNCALLFSGAGTAYPGMARGLLDTEPTFAAAIEAMDGFGQRRWGWSIAEALRWTPPRDAGPIEAQSVLLCAVEIAMARLWTSWGVEPVAVLGHSLGEYAAAAHADALQVDEALELVRVRGRLLDGLDEAGLMVGVFAAPDTALPIVLQDELLGRHITVSAVNAPNHFTLSGPAHAVRAAMDQLTRHGVEVREIPAGSAGHSPLVDPILEPLADHCAGLTMSTPTTPLVSNVTGQLWPWDTPVPVDYWLRHTREPVRFGDGVATLADMGVSTFIEVGPGTESLGMALANFKAETDSLMVPSLRRGRPDEHVLMNALARLYVRGVDIDWAAVYGRRARHCRPAPAYPFEQARCWHNVIPRSAVAVAPTIDRVEVGSPAPLEAPSRAGGVRVRLSRDELVGLGVDEQRSRLVDALTAALQEALGLTSTVIDPDDPLTGLGVDSLTAIELRNAVQNSLGVELTMVELLRDATVGGVVDAVLTRLNEDGDTRQGGIPVVDRDAQRMERVLAQLEEAGGTVAPPEVVPTGGVGQA